MQKETGGVFSACPLSLIHISYVSVFQFTQTLKQSPLQCESLPLPATTHLDCVIVPVSPTDSRQDCVLLSYRFVSFLKNVRKMLDKPAFYSDSLEQTG